MKIKELIVGNKGSYTDYDLLIADREIGLPEKKEIKETVPYLNGSYDFSKLTGELIWDERPISYVFDFADFDLVKLEREKSKFLSWVMNIYDEDIYDLYIEGYHFHGSFKSIQQSGDFGNTSVTVTFSVYPYLLKNNQTIYKYSVEDTKEILIDTNSAKRIVPEIVTDSEMTIVTGTGSHKLGAGTWKDSKIYLDGSKITIKGNGNITFTFVEEIF